MTALTEHTEILIPIIQGKEQTISTVITALSNITGGCTLTKKFGTWIDDNGDLITDDHIAATVYYAAENKNTTEKSIKAICDYIRRKLNQFSVAAVNNNTLFLIDF